MTTSDQPFPGASNRADIAELQDYLASFDLFAGIEAEGIGYLNSSMQRFLITLDMVPPASSPESRLLELGANPYFLTLMLMRHRGYQVTPANYFGAGGPAEGRGEQTIHSQKYGESHRFVYDHFNVETEPFPYASGQFDVVLCCEILEHLAVNPTQMLCEIHRVLKPQGHLLLTTPNVLAYQNLQKLALGKNIYDQYSGYGLYGRHNREYAPLEVVRLLEACHFRVVEVRLADIYRHAPGLRFLKRVRRHWRDNIFVLARAENLARYGYPSFLYRSMYHLRHVRQAEVLMDDDDESQLGSGWFPLERVPQAARWTGKEALVQLSHPGGEARLVVEFEALAATLGPVTLTLAAGETTQSLYLQADGWQTVEMTVEGTAGQEVNVCLTVDHPRNPAQLGYNNDSRDLGVLVGRVALDAGPGETAEP